MPHYNRKYILNFLYNLIKPKKYVSPKDLPKNHIFWEKVLKLGSSHLLLPAIYDSLIRKKLENYAPKDLITYIKELHSINLERNKEILTQLNFINNIFNEHNINYVLIKGSAMMILNKTHTTNNRMMGDIDILVSKKDLMKSEKLLKSAGFKNRKDKSINISRKLSIYDFRHLERLNHPDFIASVELHHELLSKKYSKLFLPVEILKNKIKVNNFYIPSLEHIWLHVIFNWYYNNNGINLNYLMFDAVRDVLFLENEKNFHVINYMRPAVRDFYSLLSVHNNTYICKSNLKKTFYLLQLKSTYLLRLNILRLKITNLIIIFLYSIERFLNNKKYRNLLIKNPSYVKQKITSFWKNQ